MEGESGKREEAEDYLERDIKEHGNTGTSNSLNMKLKHTERGE